MARTRRHQKKRQKRNFPSPPPSPAGGEGESAPVSRQPPPPEVGGFSSPNLSAFNIVSAVLALLLCLLVAVSFYPAILGGFVWDDAAFTVVAPVQDWDGIWRIWFNPRTLEHEGHYWPILYTIFWLEHKLWGFDNPAYFHIFNLILHAGVVLLLWRLLLRLRVGGARAAWVSWVAAAIFAVHPLHVESVAWVIGRKDMLAALFYLTSVMVYMRFMETRHRRHYAGSLALYVSGLFCKSIGVTLPAALLIWHWWKRDRVMVADVKRVLPFLALGLLITILDWAEYKSKEVISFDFTTLERVLLAAQSLCFYVGKLLWPTQLMIIYPRWDIGLANPLGWGYLAIVVTTATLLWKYRGKIGRGAMAGMAFFVVTLSPTLGFVDYGYMQFAYVADRYQYLAGGGVIVVVVAAAAWLVDRGLERWPGIWTRRGAYAGAALVPAAILAVLGVITWNQSGVYYNQGTLYTHIISLNPKARGAHHSLGWWHQQNGRIEEAIANYRIALEKRPNHAQITNRMGTAHETIGKLEEAEKYYRRALAVKPYHKHAITNLARLMTLTGREKEALALFRTAIRVRPEFANAYSGMGITLYRLKRYEEAVRAFDKALALNPSSRDARINRQHTLQILKQQSLSKPDAKTTKGKNGGENVNEKDGKNGDEDK